MFKTNSGKLIFCISLSLLLINTASSIEKTESQRHIYFGLSAPFNTVGGDFTGEQIFTGGIRIPDLEGSVGIGAVAGYSNIVRNNLGYAAELSYQRTVHDATQFGWESTATLHMINADIKGVYSAMPVQPYLLTGIAIPRMVVKEAFDLADVTYTGFGLNFGGGINLFVHPNLIINGSAVIRWVNYTRLKARGEKLQISGGLSGSGTSFSIGLIYALPLK